MGKEVCPKCGGKYKGLAQHWARSSSCEYPPLSEKQKEIATGLLMGDGNVYLTPSNTGKIRCIMVAKQYLEYLYDSFDIVSSKVSISKTAEEKAKENRDSGFSPNAKEENYQDQYIWESKTHPYFTNLHNWYKSGEKIWPDNIQLTPTVLKHWYVGDGCANYKSGSNYITISAFNESENGEKVKKYFVDSGLPKPSLTHYERDFGEGMVLRFSVDDSEKLWEYMGEPLDGFEYKWPEKYR